MYYVVVFEIVKFIYSEKATKFCEMFPLILTVCTVLKSKGNISQKILAFSEYMNFQKKYYRGTGTLVFQKKVSETFTQAWSDWLLSDLQKKNVGNTQHYIIESTFFMRYKLSVLKRKWEKYGPTI